MDEQTETSGSAMETFSMDDSPGHYLTSSEKKFRQRSR